MGGAVDLDGAVGEVDAVEQAAVFEAPLGTLLLLFALIGSAMTYYFFELKETGATTVFLVLAFSVVGMAGSYAVAWYGIRVNTYANCRTAFAALRGEPWDVVNIPLRAGMSVGLFS